ncbi:MAG: hypothetical protein LBP22_12780 [Deltaproteobacteria bacterium]|jgi:hypothetical protein|nr:hypothetical protein [Deltaproteobacteria bacterium]
MKINNQEVQAVFLRPNQKPQAPAFPGTETDFASLLNPRKEVPKPLELGQDLLKPDLIGQLQANQAVRTENTGLYTAAEDIEKLLDLLDNYSQALADPANTLKDLSPLADDLGLMAQELGQTSARLGEDDPLKSLSNDTASLAAVEAMKFKRGDYL